MTTIYETLQTDLAEGVLTVTLNRPDKLNAYNPAMQRDLLDLFGRINADDEVRDEAGVRGPQFRLYLFEGRRLADATTTVALRCRWLSTSCIHSSWSMSYRPISAPSQWHDCQHAH